MSNVATPIEPVGIVMPEIALNQKREYGVLKGPMITNWEAITTTSYNNEGFLLSYKVPDFDTIVDRTFFLSQPVTISFTGTSPPGQNIIQTGTDAFRSFPIASITNSIKLTIDTADVSMDTSEVIQPLLRSSLCTELLEKGYSMTPTSFDQTQEYVDLVGAIRNPLGGYSDSIDGAATGRGSFPIEVLTNNPTAATITARFTEPLFVSPTTHGDDRLPGLVGIQNLTLNMRYNNLTRIWSHMGGTTASTITSITVTIGQPTWHIKTYKPKETMYIPRISHYSYYEVIRQSTDLGSSVAPNAGVDIISGTYTFTSVPHKLLIYVRERLSDRTYLTTDTYFSIDAITAQWGNHSGLLSSATQRDLYEISRRNGVDLSWIQWSGGPTDSMKATSNINIGTVGSILILRPGEDFGLGSIADAPGVGGQYQIQIRVRCTNRNQARSIFPSLYMIGITEGVFEVADRRSTVFTNPLTPEDVVMCKVETNKHYTYSGMQKLAVGGNIFGDIWNRAKKVFDFIAPVATPALNIAARAFPGFAPVREVIRGVTGHGMMAGAYNKGMPKRLKQASGVSFEDEEEEPMPVKKGGAVVSRQDLANRIR